MQYTEASKSTLKSLFVYISTEHFQGACWFILSTYDWNCDCFCHTKKNTSSQDLKNVLYITPFKVFSSTKSLYRPAP